MTDFYTRARAAHDKKHYEEALSLYRAGTEAGDEKCYYGMALFLLSSYGCVVDEAEANRLFVEHFEAIRSLSKDGDAVATMIIGFYYYNGFPPIAEDAEKAMEYYIASAESGNAIA